MTRTTHQVVWTQGALQDLKSIFTAIYFDRPQTAAAILKKLTALGVALKHYPERGRRIPELMLLGKSDHHEIILKPWRLMYRISGLQIQILAVLDSRRNIQDHLAHRLLKS